MLQGYVGILLDLPIKKTVISVKSKTPGLLARRFRCRGFLSSKKLAAAK